MLVILFLKKSKLSANTVCHIACRLCLFDRFYIRMSIAGPFYKAKTKGKDLFIKIKFI